MMRQTIYPLQRKFPEEFVIFLDEVNEEKSNYHDASWSVKSDFALQYVIDAWNNNITNASDVVQTINQAINNSAYEEWIRSHHSC
jgi:uncharacterized protein YukE